MTRDERIAALDVRLGKLYKRHRDVIQSIERAQAARTKLVREKERSDEKNRRLVRLDVAAVRTEGLESSST